MKPQQSSGRNVTAVLPGQTVLIESLPWNPHPKYAGVFLRHMVTGNDTGGRMSLHHVRIDPGCAIGDHAHNGQVETHDVLEGSGTCTLEGKKIAYVPGVLGVMPADKVHRVDAGEGGLLLLTTFSPPLV
ncbi:cupin domain-containing protein [Methanoregula sp. PtaB.Bin085]|uniref:cupin domain-containing protein n=1 Tax=Methanoregula sp. PtaB.Bin085 TaxID=1811680 RepID=UPI0009D4A19D|nr:cupin domain-containing protein [Methanoregula sp. PtaB.Bin085]OPX64820.1 MAG: Cupin domain protein [Methanoregula sp. PtaB.Bin085]